MSIWKPEELLLIFFVPGLATIKLLKKRPLHPNEIERGLGAYSLPSRRTAEL